MQRHQAAIRMVLALSLPLLSTQSLAAGKKRPNGASRGSGNGAFLLNTLPKGKDVTMPQPATTYVPLSARILLTATDMPQTLSFRPVHLGQGSLPVLKLVIFDENADRVQYRSVQPGTPFLYPVKTLTTVTVLAEAVGPASSEVFLQVESDKPLTIAH